MVPLGCPVRPGNKALQVEFGAGNPSLITVKKKSPFLDPERMSANFEKFIFLLNYNCDASYDHLWTYGAQMDRQ